MAAGRGEDDTAQRDQHDIARVDRQVAHDSREDEARREQEVGNAFDQAAQSGTEKAGPFGDTRADHHHQNHAQGVETGEGLGHLDQQAADIFRREQVLGDDGLAGERVFGGQPGQGRNHRRAHDDTDQDNKDGHRIGQAVAGALDGVEKRIAQAHGVPLDDVAE